MLFTMKMVRYIIYWEVTVSPLESEASGADTQILGIVEWFPFSKSLHNEYLRTQLETSSQQIPTLVPKRQQRRWVSGFLGRRVQCREVDTN